jgi:hypothetical protein
MEKQVYEAFVLPITFKTVSFHHRADYSLRIFCKANQEILAARALHQFKTPSRIEIDERSGNIVGIGGSVHEN